MTERKPRILLIDDDPNLLRLAEAMLRKAGYEVSSATDPAHGLQILNRESLEFDGVITDAMMPVLSGYEVVQTIRRHPRYSDIPILMLTRKRNAEDVKKAVQAGVNDYVVKPIDEALLISKLGLCLTRLPGSAKKPEQQVFETLVHGYEGEGHLRLPLQVTALSEAGLTLRLPVPVSGEAPLSSEAFESTVFKEIGISVPMLRFLSCEKVKPLAESPELEYEVRLTFVGITEKELMKIRNWIQKRELRRRK